jgi:hypothetical protein
VQTYLLINEKNKANCLLSLAQLKAIDQTQIHDFDLTFDIWPFSMELNDKEDTKKVKSNYSHDLTFP